MWLVLLFVAMSVVIILIKFAIRPLRTLLLIVRVLAFFIALGVWIVFFTMQSGSTTSMVGSLWIPIVFTIPWLLTFIPGRSRRRT